jgi:hypothetical protein
MNTNILVIVMVTSTAACVVLLGLQQAKAIRQKYFLANKKAGDKPE